MEKNNKRVSSENDIDLSTISGVACCVLVAIYKKQITDIESVELLKIGFESSIFAGKKPCDERYNQFEFAKELLSITNNNSLLISAFRYLKDKDYLLFDESKRSNIGYSFYNFHLTANGVDLIENSKNNLSGRKNFAKVFNLGVTFNLNNYIKAINIGGGGGASFIG